MDVLVLGAGSLGSLVGGLLARAHEVTLVGRDPHVSAVRAGGLSVTGTGAFTVHPGATTDGRGRAADLALVTVKSYDTADAARALATGTYGAVCSLQNGLGNEDVLADHLDCPVLAGTTDLAAVLADPGHVEWWGGSEVTLGPWAGEDAGQAADRAAAAFREAGVEATATDDVRPRLWEKLAVNAAINPVTALARTPNRAVLDPPARDLALAAAEETARVARAAGVDLSGTAAREAVASVARDTADNRSSMYQDVAAGRRTEVDAITGHVVDRAEDLGADVPTNRTLLALLRTWEAARGLR